MKTRQKYREPVLRQYKRLWLNKEAYDKIRSLKRNIKKSMTQIALELIREEFEKMNKTKNKKKKVFKKQI